MDNDVTLSFAEIDLLRHMIRFEYFRVKKGKYSAYRNSFATYKPNPKLERMCDLGVCSKRVSELSGRPLYYFLTEKGAELLSEYLGVTVALQ